MPTTAKTAAQTWIRAELVGVPDSPFGPQLMIPADGVEFHGPDLVFHHDGEVVYVTRPDQLRSLTWLGPATDPDRERRRAQWPNHGKRWTDDQRERLRAEIVAGAGWEEIAKSHGRSRTGVQQEAVKQGWIDSESLRPAPGLFDDDGGGGPVRDENDVGEWPGREIRNASETVRTPGSSRRVRIRPRRGDGDAPAGGSPAVTDTAAGGPAADASQPRAPEPARPSGIVPSSAPERPYAEADVLRPVPVPVRVLGSYATTTTVPGSAVPADPAPGGVPDPSARPPGIPQPRDPESRPPELTPARPPGT